MSGGGINNGGGSNFGDLVSIQDGGGSNGNGENNSNNVSGAGSIESVEDVIGNDFNGSNNVSDGGNEGSSGSDLRKKINLFVGYLVYQNNYQWNIEVDNNFLIS